MSERTTVLRVALEDWLNRERAVRSAVLFGSQARSTEAQASADKWSDIDLHIVTDRADRIIKTDWANAIKGVVFCFQVLRPASAGVRKLTLLFEEGEADLVLVDLRQMRMAWLAINLGLHRHLSLVSKPLNILATILGGGYRFLKGEHEWGATYAKILVEMEGVRLRDHEVVSMANVFLCDLVWTLQKIERGELVASQRAIHQSLYETNILLLHELRTRLGESTFQQARRVEKIVTPAQLMAVQVSSGLNKIDLAAAAWRAREGLNSLMKELVPSWRVPAAMEELLARHAPAKPAR